jgi:O-antigen/teichoic acid export membrane protein
MFSEMGLGAAIVQKDKVTQNELSSIFWFSIVVGVIFAAASLVLAYPTSWIFDEPRVIPVTQFISVLFIISALMIVPSSLLAREARFKEIGMIQLIAVVVTSLCMLLMAKAGYGVWTLIGGGFIQKCLTVILTFAVTKWHPEPHFDFSEAKPLLKFGINVAGSRSLYYVFQKSDKFIVGKMFNAQFLGYYSLAMQLSSIPTEKIVSTIQQVAYPVFARYQNNPSKFQNVYLELIKYVSFIVMPLFLGGMFLGEEIILVCLGEKWAPITLLFRFLCLAQLLESISTINGVVHNAAGRPRWFLYFTLGNILVMPISIFVASRYGFDMLAIPWVTFFPAISIFGTWLTIKKFEIPISAFIKRIISPLLASVFMIAAIWGTQVLIQSIWLTPRGSVVTLLQELIVGALCYFSYLGLYERKSILALWDLRKN